MQGKNRSAVSRHTGSGSIAPHAAFELLERRTLMSSGPVVADPIFATPAEPAGDGYHYNPAGSGWTFLPAGGGTFAGGAGIAVSDVYPGELPEPPVGTQAGFLQGPDAVISQDISSFAAGAKYTLTYYEAGRDFAGGANPYEVLVDGQVIVSKRVPQSLTTFDKVSATFSVASAGSHTLSFDAFGNGAFSHDGTSDVSTFISDVQLASVSAASISGTVFSDSNANGTLNSGEKGLANVRVFIDAKDTGSYVSSDVSVFTSSTGSFTFAGLGAGTYRIREVLPAGYVSTAPSTGYFNVTVAKSNVTGLLFADAPAKASVSGTVFVDFNSDGKIDGGDFGLGLWTLTLTYTSGVFKGQVVTTTTTATGTYSFTDLTAGTCTLKVTPPVKGVTPTKPAGNVLDLSLVAGEVSTGNLFGEI